MLTIIYRFVGGFITQEGTTATRLIFSTLLSLYLAFAMLVKGFGYGPICIVLVTSFMTAYAGRWIPHGWTWQIKSPWGYVFMSLIGLVRVALWMAPAFYFMPSLTPLCLFGLLSGPAYAIGKNLLNDVDSGIYHMKNAIIGRTGERSWKIALTEEPSCFAKGWTEWGEVLTGELCYSLPYILLLAL